ncbi:MAG: hydantoinase/oxoprolinase family protein [Gammaproteobacteria bacterium]
MTYRIGTDIGGTFTDLVLADETGLIGRFKSPTTPGDVTQGVLDCLALAARSIRSEVGDLLAQTQVLVHGSTVATNAVLEGKVAKCAVLCSRGTRYTLWRGEGRRNDIFNFVAPPGKPLVPPHLCVELTERIDRDGKVLVALDDEEVRREVLRLRELDCEALAVCLLWSVRNPSHEMRVERIVRDIWPDVALSLSSEVQPVLREYVRMSCTALNAMLKPVVAAYLNRLAASLRTRGLSGEILVVASDGGVQPIDEIAERPVYMLFSGPSTGPAAARIFAAREQARDCLLIDMGGTSFDVSTVIDDHVGVTRDGRINNHPTGVSAVQILTLGAGGGSIARVDDGGLLHVGPESAGARPGPVCYGRGGTEPTVTDAYLALGLLVADRFLGGRMRLDAEAATAAIRTRVAEPLGISTTAGALGICRVINERMVNGILEMTVRKGIDPRRLVLVTGGGATGIAAADLARELGIRRILVPRETSALCAFGALNADLCWSSVASLPANAQAFDYDAVNAALTRLGARGVQFLDRLGVPAERRRLDVYAAARYPLQVTEIEVPCPGAVLAPPDLAAVCAAFHAAHEARYAVAEPDTNIEFVMWRVAARGVTPPVRLAPDTVQATSLDAAVVGRSRLYDQSVGDFVEARMLDPERMAVGLATRGPALVVATDTTVFVPSDACVSMRDGGYLVIDLENRKEDPT